LVEETEVEDDEGNSFTKNVTKVIDREGKLLSTVK